MTDSWLDFNVRPVQWNEESRAALCHFLGEVANTRLKVKILEIFLYEPYLCLSSACVAERLRENQQLVQESARQLHARGAFLYCESFGYADTCCLSFHCHAPSTQWGLCLLRFALRTEPQAVWAQVA